MAMAWKKKVVIKWIVLFTAELLATAFLLFLGCGLLVVDTIPSKSVPLVQVGLGWGFAVLTSVQIFGHISGAHLNPAVTVAAATLGIFPLLQVPLYIGGQVIGGILGYLMLAAITPKDFLYKHEFSDFQNKTVGICQTRINKDISLVQGFFAEFFAVLIIAMFCGAVWDKKNSQQIGSAAIKFSSLITILVFVLANYTGASFNPARSFGPAVVSGGWEDHWVYWIAPISGGFVGALIYRLIFLKFMPMNDLIIKTPVKDEVGEVP